MALQLETDVYKAVGLIESEDEQIETSEDEIETEEAEPKEPKSKK